MEAAYELHHSLTGTRITFTPFTNIYGEAVVGIQMVCGANYGTATRTPEEARVQWQAWLKVGALDLRKFMVEDGMAYTREADGRVSLPMTVGQRLPNLSKYAPQGYAFDCYSYEARDAGLSSDENSVRIYFKRA